MNQAVELAKQTYRAVKVGGQSTPDILQLLKLIRFAIFEEKSHPALPGTNFALVDLSLYLIRNDPTYSTSYTLPNLENKLVRLGKQIIVELKQGLQNPSAVVESRRKAKASRFRTKFKTKAASNGEEKDLDYSSLTEKEVRDLLSLPESATIEIGKYGVTFDLDDLTEEEMDELYDYYRPHHHNLDTALEEIVDQYVIDNFHSVESRRKAKASRFRTTGPYFTIYKGKPSNESVVGNFRAESGEEALLMYIRECGEKKLLKYGLDIDIPVTEQREAIERAKADYNISKQRSGYKGIHYFVPSSVAKASSRIPQKLQASVTSKIRKIIRNKIPKAR